MELNLNTNNGSMKLEGASNWNIWKFQTTVLLRGHNWLDIVEGKSTKPEEGTQKASWESKDAKAQTLLVTRMTENVMLHIISCSTSAEMWNKLQSVYEQKTETNIHIIQQRFFQYKYETGSDMSTFLSKIQELQNQLKQMGEKISDKFVITKVLMSLPDEYKHFVSAWESAPDDKQTINNLVARLLAEEDRLREKSGVNQHSPYSPGSSAAFVVKDKKNVRCFKCNRLGHFISECKSNNNSKSEGHSSKCFYCGKTGHSKAQCWFKKSKEHKKSNAFLVSSSLVPENKQSQWLVDSGASQHMCCDRALFSSFSDTTQESVIVGNGASISVLGYGQMAVEVFNGSEWVATTIDKVLFVPELKTNLFSVNCASDKGYVMLTDDSSCKFYKNSKLCAIAKRVGSSYYLEFRYRNKVANVAKTVNITLEEWHERLAHQNFEYVRKILLKNNIDVKQTSVPKCESCLEGKIHRLPFSSSENVSRKTCELIHADTCGPMEVMSVGGSKYYVVLKDDFSNYRSVYFVKNKYEIKNCIEDFINKAENVTGNKVKVFRSDNGLEFVNKEVKEMFSKRGILHQTSVPYTPEQNGKAERENRTLVEAARTMLSASKSLPKTLWAEAVHTAAYVLNRTGKSKDGEKSPYEVWSGKSFDIHCLKPFGTPVYAHIPKEKRKKWDSKGEKGMFVGYDEAVKGFRIYFSHKNSVEIKRDIVFLEKERNNENEGEVLVTYSEENEDSDDEPRNEPVTPLSPPTPSKSDESESEYSPAEDEDDSELDLTYLWTKSPKEYSKRVRKPPVFHNCQNVYTQDSEPVTYGEAMSRKDASKWSEAIDREMQTLKENHTWEVCDEPVNERVITSIIVVNDPVINARNFSTWEWILTERPGLFGLVGGCANPTGVALVVILAVMCLCSQPFIRRGGSFEIFYWTHLLYVPFWLLLLFHAPNFWKWFALPGTLYVAERIIRLAAMRSNHGKTYISSGILLPSRVTHLVVRRPPLFDFHAGDYVFVNIPAIARYEWHPFTISSAPDQEDYIWLHIRGVGQWTNTLYEYFEKEHAKLHAGEVPAEHEKVARTSSNQSNKSKRKSSADGKKRSVDFSPEVKEYSNEGFTMDEEKAMDFKALSPSNGRPALLTPLRHLEKSRSMPDVHTRDKNKQRLLALQDYPRSESERSFDAGSMASARRVALGLAYRSPQNRALAHSFRYMRTKPTIIAFKTPSMESCERRRSNESIITVARRRLSKSLSPDKDVECPPVITVQSPSEASTDSFANYPVGKPLEIYLDGPYGAASSHIFRAEHAALIAAGIGVTPFASILQAIMYRYWNSRNVCPRCDHKWASSIAQNNMNLKKVDFFWINREQRSFEWFVSLLSQLEIEQAESGARFLEMHMYITSALQRSDMKAVGLQLALDLLHEKEKRDLITGLKTRTNAGRPNWDKVFQQLQEQRKGKITVFYCGPPQLARILRVKCDQFGFSFRKEVF